MPRICTSCNSEIPENAGFCTECGVKAPDIQPAADTAPEAPVAVAAPIAEPEPAIESSPFPEDTPVQDNIPLPETQTEAVPKGGKYGVVGMGTFFGLQLLYGIPVAGLIASLIMSFAPKNKNIKNFARSSLVWSLIGTAVIIVIYLLANMLINFIGAAVNSLFAGFMGNALNLGPYAIILEQFESGELIDVIDDIQNGNYDAIKDSFSAEDFDAIVEGFESGEFDELIKAIENGDYNTLIELIESGEYDELLDSLKDIDFSSIGPIDNETAASSSSSGDYPALIMVNDSIYYYTYEDIAESEINEEDIIGYTVSYSDSMPTQNGETNFLRDTGSPYAQYEDGVAVFFEGKWGVFEAKN